MNAIIEAAGWTILHFLWQGVVIGALFGLFLAIVRNRPQARYLAGCAALLAMVGAVAATFAYHYQPAAREARHREATPAEPPAVVQTVLSFDHCRPCHSVETVDSGPGRVSLPEQAGSCQPALAIAVLPTTPPPDPPNGPASGNEPPVVASPPVFSWLVWIWLAGVVLLSLRFTISCGVTQQLRGHGSVPVGDSLAVNLRRIAEQVGVAGPVQALKSTAVAVPTVVGWLRPVILLPVASLAGLSPSQLEAVLAHELAHIRRHDYFVNLLQHLVEIVLFFHPAVWWISKKIREEREHCCDDIAVAASGGTLDYARALAALEELRGDRFVLGMAANGGSLLARIRRLGGADNSQRRPLLLISALILLAGLAVPFAVLPARETKPGKETGRPAKSQRVLLLPSDQAAEGLRHLLAKEPEASIPFDDFALLARSLDEKSIVSLLDEIGMERSDGYRAWTRSALYAEWASRDLDAALADFRKRFKNFRGILEQVPHALFVGSRPQDPWAALTYLRSLPDDPRFRLNLTLNGKPAPMIYLNRDWVKETYRRLFRELAALDPEQAWKQLPGRNGEAGEPLNHNRILSTNYAYQGMVDGFFSGLKDRETLELFVERFGPVGEPGTEPFAIVIAKAWMVHDLAAAQAWAPPQRNDPFMANLIYGVDGNAARSWAREYPEDALQAIRDEALPKWNYLMAECLLEGNPHLASELVDIFEATPTPPAPPPTAVLTDRADNAIRVTPPISIPPKEGRPPAVYFALRNSMPENAEVDERGAFPEPGRSNRPLDFRARYESYRAAIANDVFSQDEQAELRAHLEAAFEDVLAGEIESNRPNP